MAKKEKHTGHYFERILDYFRGRLSSDEQHRLEKQMMSDPFEEEAFDGLSMLLPDELEADLADLQSRLHDKTTQKKSFILHPVFRYAAAAVILLGIGTTIFLVRQSLEKATSIRELAETIDTTTSQKKSKSNTEDSLKQNIAYTTPVERKTEKGRSAEAVRINAEPAAITKASGEAEKEARKTEMKSPDYKSVPMEEVTLKNPDEIRDITLEKASEQKNEAMGKASGLEITEAPPVNRSRAAQTMHDMQTFAKDNEDSENFRLISGLVISEENGEPLPGVNVVVDGTSEGTITDVQGKFALSVPDNQKVNLNFNYVGYESEVVAVDKDKEINLAMSEDLLALDEVVVVGYGTRKKKMTTGAVTTVTGEELTHEPPEASMVIKPAPAVRMKEFKDYISENIRYEDLPPLDKAVVVKLNFTVTVKGSIRNISVKKSAGEDFDNEAIRLLREGPDWVPGTINGTTVEDEVNLKIKFEPQSEN